MKAIIYARVSTAEQAASGLGMHGQIAQCEAFANYRGHEVIEVLTENGCSGSKAPADRPELSKGLAMLEAGEAQILIAAKLDRIGRDVRDVLDLVADADRQGWGLAVLDLDLDSSTPHGRLVLTMFAALAEWERNVIAARTSAALQVKKAAGERLGRPIEHDPAVREQVRAMRSAGVSMNAVAQHLNAAGTPTPRGGKWHASTIRSLEQSDRLDAEAAAARESK